MKMIKKMTLLLVVVLLLSAFTACGQDNKEMPPYADAPAKDSLVADPNAYANEEYGFQLDMPKEGETVAIMHTNKGDISIRLFPEAAPKTVQNFILHAQKGYFDGLTFHRVINDFMIQGGDPKGDGTGDAGKDIKGEFTANGFTNNLKHVRGVISMARGNEPDSASCQFFICDSATASLDGNYAAFGYVMAGMETVDSIASVEVQSNGREMSDPVKDVIIEKIVFVKDNHNH